MNINFDIKNRKENNESMTKNKGNYKPSEQDMKDAWIMWYVAKYLVQETLDKQKDIGRYV